MIIKAVKDVSGQIAVWLKALGMTPRARNELMNVVANAQTKRDAAERMRRELGEEKSAEFVKALVSKAR